LISSWWAVVGGLVEAVQVYAGLTLVNKVGAGLFVGFTVNAERIPSLLIDHFGRLRMQPHPLHAGRISAQKASRDEREIYHRATLP
jgi:bacterial/archaeal transporter family-2 protein